MGLCSESSGRRGLVWERWASPIFDINCRETKKEKYQRPTLIHGGLGFYETSERCSHRSSVGTFLLSGDKDTQGAAWMAAAY